MFIYINIYKDTIILLDKMFCEKNRLLDSSVLAVNGLHINELNFCSDDISDTRLSILYNNPKKIGSDKESGYKNIYTGDIRCQVFEKTTLSSFEFQSFEYQELVDNKYGYTTREKTYLPEKLLKAAGMNLSNFQLINEHGHLCTYSPIRDPLGNYKVYSTKYMADEMYNFGKVLIVSLLYNLVSA